MTTTIIVMGNCQAWPMTAILKLMLPGHDIQQPVVVQQVKPDHEHAVHTRLESADLILAQVIKDNHPITFLRTSKVRERFGDRLTTWVNLFYRGQNPELCYLPELTAQGEFPLGDYHLETVREAFVEGADVAEALFRLSDPDWNSQRYADTARKSLAWLRRQEQQADAPITDEIARREESEQLFFTFNHPSMQLLADYALRLTDVMGLTPDVRYMAGAFPEQLARIIAPPNPMTARGRAFATFPGPRSYRALRPATDPESTQPIMPILMTEEEVVGRFYETYQRLTA